MSDSGRGAMNLCLLIGERPPRDSVGSFYEPWEALMPNSTDPRDKSPSSETAEQKAERERLELEKKRRELQERIEREKYERDNM